MASIESIGQLLSLFENMSDEDLLSLYDHLVEMQKISLNVDRAYIWAVYTELDRRTSPDFS